MGQRVHEYRLTIREGHLDTFGHVNNATYLELLEEARWQWITDGGYGLTKVREFGKGPTIVECTIAFKKELLNRQNVMVRSWVESYVRKVATVRQDMLLDNGELSCSASFVMGLFDVRERRLIPPTEEWLRCLGWTLDDWRPH